MNNTSLIIITSDIICAYYYYLKLSSICCETIRHLYRIFVTLVGGKVDTLVGAMVGALYQVLQSVHSVGDVVGPFAGVELCTLVRAKHGALVDAKAGALVEVGA